MDLHIFFLPFLAPGHMIPIVDLAKLFASRGVKATIVTTVGNAHRISPSLDRFPNGNIILLTLPFPSSTPDNCTFLPTPDPTPEFVAGLDSLETPFERLVLEHRPDCIVTDVYYPWSVDVAFRNGIPRVVFHGSSSFTNVIGAAIGRFKPHENVVAEGEPFVVPGLPHRIELLKCQLPNFGDDKLVIRMMRAKEKTYGIVMNSFYDMEPGYAEQFTGSKSWLVGPVSLCNRDVQDKAVRGGGGGGGGEGGDHEFDDCLNWLDDKNPGSVLYVCFGSLGQFTSAQLGEIAAGLTSSGHPFIWVLRNATDDNSDWMRLVSKEKGFVIKGWAPQMVILNHRAVGGFLTHCGWNSCLEGASSGVPMITWPLFADQFFNERLLVDVLRIGVAVGSKVCSMVAEERMMVSSEKLKMVIEEVMGSGEEAGERRKRAKEVAEMAETAVGEGGSSYNDLSRLIQELTEIKAGRVEYSSNVAMG